MSKIDIQRELLRDTVESERALSTAVRMIMSQIKKMNCIKHFTEHKRDTRTEAVLRSECTKKPTQTKHENSRRLESQQ